MRVICVGVRPTEQQQQSGSPSLTPEMLAACGARYSRNGEGLPAILELLKGLDDDKAVDRIFKMVDYGHQSIADMVPVSMFMDGISMGLALRAWSLCPTAGGQESSTRYIKLASEDSEPVVEFDSADDTRQWKANVEQCFAAYDQALTLWQQIAEDKPELMRLPEDLLKSEEPKDRRKADRLKRNFAFDRARYYLPMSAKTNVMLLMSARGWVSLIKQLASENNSESVRLADKLRDELENVAPRMTRHARRDDSYVNGFADELQQCVDAINADSRSVRKMHESGAFLEVFVPSGITSAQIRSSLQHHGSRYDHIGTPLQRTSVRFGWQALPIAEIRDLNRHRTGSKYFNGSPVGCYFADDEIIRARDAGCAELCDKLDELREVGEQAVQLGRDRLAAGHSDFPYWLPMGTQCFYEHTTTANHFLYQAELRTGLGAHYHYADKMREVLRLWHEQYPETKEFVKAGTAEPE